MKIKTYLRCKKVSVSSKVSKAFTISEIDASRSTGVPQLEIVNKNAYVVWTVSEDKKNQLKTVKFLFEGLD